MAHTVTIFGYVKSDYRAYLTYWTREEAFGQNARALADFFDQNVVAVLCRQMFHCFPSATSARERDDAAFRCQFIHFASAYRGLLPSEILSDKNWLNEFEELLARLFWTEVKVQVDPEIGPITEFVYRADYSVFDFGLQGPRPTTKWKRSTLTVETTEVTEQPFI